ncbi:cell division protein FtsA [Patescibacteria group bacterium]|nr:cell division protein FtsA [Patescibacteria group bacterium]
MTREIIMGIDVGTSSVKTIIAEKNKSDAAPYILGAGISPSHGLRKGVIINTQDVAIAIKNSVKNASKNLNNKPRQAFVSINGIGIDGIKSKGSVVVSRADHEISENDLKRVISQSEEQLKRSSSPYILNREILHTFPLSYRIDNETIIGDPAGMKGGKLEVETLFITVPSQHLSNLLKSVDMAGITVEDIVADPLAMSHAILNKKEKEVGCLLVSIGGDISSLIVFEEGNPISLEILPIGSNHITYDIAQGFQVLLEEADQLKMNYGNDLATKKKLNTIIVPRLNDIFELIENHLVKIKRTKLLPAGIIISGGGANLSGIDEIAKSSLKLPTRLSRPSLSAINDPVWSVALGLCYAGFGEKNNSIGAGGIGSKAKNLFSRCIKNLLP